MKKKRILALILAVAMIISFIPQMSFAATDYPTTLEEYQQYLQDDELAQKAYDYEQEGLLYGWHTLNGYFATLLNPEDGLDYTEEEVIEMFKEELNDIIANEEQKRLEKEEEERQKAEEDALREYYEQKRFSKVVPEVYGNFENFNKQAILDEINKIRAKEGVDPVVWNSNYEEAAMYRAMQVTLNYNHIGWPSLECIALVDNYHGDEAARQAVRLFDKSSAHHKLLVDEEAYSMAMGIFTNEYGICGYPYATTGVALVGYLGGDLPGDNEFKNFTANDTSTKWRPLTLFNEARNWNRAYTYIDDYATNKGTEDIEHTPIIAELVGEHDYNYETPTMVEGTSISNPSMMAYHVRGYARLPYSKIESDSDCVEIQGKTIKAVKPGKADVKFYLNTLNNGNDKFYFTVPLTIKPPCEHTFGDWTYKCEEKKKVRNCTKCGTPEEEAISGHDWTKKKTVEATCEHEGYTLYKCNLCGAEKQEDVTPARSEDGQHHMEVTKKVTATCGQSGYTIKTCSICGLSEKTDYVASLGKHSYGKAKKVKSTCTKKGYTYKKCKKCGHVHKYSYKKLAKHKYKYRGKVKATCSTKAYKLYKCKKCGKVKKSYYGKATGKHSLATRVITPATFEEDGVMQTYCKNGCGYKKNSTIPQLTIEQSFTETKYNGEFQLPTVTVKSGNTVVSHTIKGPGIWPGFYKSEVVVDSEKYKGTVTVSYKITP